MGSIPGSGRSPGEGNGNPLQYSCLENSMDRGNWWATVHRVTKSWTQLSNLAHALHMRVKRVNPEFSSQERIFFPISLILYLYEMIPVVVKKKRSDCSPPASLLACTCWNLQFLSSFWLSCSFSLNSYLPLLPFFGINITPRRRTQHSSALSASQCSSWVPSLPLSVSRHSVRLTVAEDSEREPNPSFHCAGS